MIINALKLARQQSVLEGDMPLIEVLSKLTDDGRIGSVSQAAKLSYRLGFYQRYVDTGQEYRTVVVTLDMQCEPQLLCHSSERLFGYTVDASSQIALLDDADAVNELQKDMEVFVCQLDALDIKDVLAEELMLSLPLVPRHPDVDPVEFVSVHEGNDIDRNTGTSAIDSPFSVLQTLQKK